MEMTAVKNIALFNFVFIAIFIDGQVNVIAGAA
jgi:hypothetical protein